MARLIYSTICSLDGYIEDLQGKFDWAEPDDEVFGFITHLERPVAAYLLGRRTYETMQVWETDPSLAALSPLMGDFAQVWQKAEKTVYSRILKTVPTFRTRIEHNFDPQAVRRLKESAGAELLIGGPELAAHALRAGLVDECQLYLTPILVGGGKPALPSNLRLKLELLEERRFSSGVVFLRYRIK